MPQLQPTLNPKIDTLADFLEAANITEPPSWGRQVKLKFEPRQHQVTGLNHLAQYPRAGIWDDPGTGKTFFSQAHALWLVGLGNRALCVMPPTLVPQFHASLYQNFPGVGAFVSIAMFGGTIEERDLLLEGWNQSGWPQILIMSNDMFIGKSKKETLNLQAQRIKAIKNRGKKLQAAVTALSTAMGPTQEILEALIKAEAKLQAAKDSYADDVKEASKLSLADSANVDLWLKKGYNHLLLDEATSIKNPGSTLHHKVYDFVGEEKETNGLVLMTGSPLENNATDAYGPIALLTPSRYGSYRSFERTHVVKTLERFPKVIGYQNLDYLWRSLYLRGRRVTKRECLDLPPQMYSEIQVTLSKKHKALYDKLAKERVLEIGDRVIDATAASSLYVKSQRMLLCPELFAEEGWKDDNALLDAVDELVHELAGRKLLLFAWYTESIDKLARHYAKFNPAVLNGDVTGAERERQKAKFINDNSCRIMVANPRSGGVGIDGLQEVCSYCAFVETITSPGLLDQALSRLHRSGQKDESVNVYLFTVLRTISVKMRNSLVTKEGQANAVVRDARQVLADLMGDEGIQGSLG